MFVAGIILIGLVAALVLPAFSDYVPRAKVTQVLSMAAGLALSIEESCSNQSLTLGHFLSERTELQNSDLVDTQSLLMDESGKLTLRITLNEIRWSAPWRWSPAINAGEAIILSGKCTSTGRFNWRLDETNVHLKFLPNGYRSQVLTK